MFFLSSPHNLSKEGTLLVKRQNIQQMKKTCQMAALVVLLLAMLGLSSCKSGCGCPGKTFRMEQMGDVLDGLPPYSNPSSAPAFL